MIVERILGCLPVQYVKRFRPKKNTWSSKHYQLLFVGHQHDLAIAGDTITLTPRLVLLVKPDQQIFVNRPSEHIFSIMFHSSFLDTLFENQSAFTYLISPVPGKATIHLDELEQELNQQHDHDHESTMIYRRSMSIFSIISEMIIMSKDSLESCIQKTKSKPRSDGRSIIYAARYIRMESGNSELSLQDMAKAVGYHPNYFCQEFKRILNISPYQYLTRIRVDMALEMLKNTNEPIKKICEKTGIKKTSSLSILVKERVGMTPLEYRRFVKLQEIKQNHEYAQPSDSSSA